MAAFARSYELSTESFPGTPQYPESIADLAFAPDGTSLAILTTQGRVFLWDTATWQEQRRLRVGDAQRRWTSRGRVYTVDATASLEQRGQAVEEIQPGWLRFSPDGRLLAIGGGGEITLWDPATGAAQGMLGAADDAPSVCGAFAPDGKTLVTGTAEGRLRIWDLPSRRDLPSLSGHLSRVSGVAFAPDGRTLASCSWDRTIRLWNVATWQEVATLEGHTNRVHALAFARDGRLLVSGGDAEVLHWRAATDRLPE